MREEIDEVLGDRTTVTADDLESLHYTEQVNSPAGFESLIVVSFNVACFSS